jgi:hypothetical protein
MRQIRIARRRTRSADEQETLPLDARDPEIVRAHQAARRAKRAPAQSAQPSPASGDR